MKKKIVIAIVIVVVVFAALAGTKVLQFGTLIAAGKAYVPPPESVAAAVVHEEKWQNTLGAIGSVAAVQGVIVAPEIDGTVREIGFESGATVAQGDLLVRLDTSTEEAQLAAADAQAQLARLNAERARSLRANNTISQAELDAVEATLKQNQGNADATRALIGKKTIRAPFAGRTGIRTVNLGQYLEKGQAIVSLQSLSPIYGVFSLPQQNLSLVQTGMRVRLTTDTYPDKHFDGTLNAVNPDLDANTRSLKLQATFENPEQLLRPGMFARMEVVLPQDQTVLVIPATSVLSAPYGDSVYIIEPSKATNSAPGTLVVRQQFIRIGQMRGDFISVETGLKAGQRVVGSGLFKMRNGMSVIESNELAPKASEKPHPADS